MSRIAAIRTVFQHPTRCNYPRRPSRLASRDTCRRVWPVAAKYADVTPVHLANPRCHPGSLGGFRMAERHGKHRRLQSHHCFSRRDHFDVVLGAPVPQCLLCCIIFEPVPILEAAEAIQQILEPGVSPTAMEDPSNGLVVIRHVAFSKAQREMGSELKIVLVWNRKVAIRCLEIRRSLVV